MNNNIEGKLPALFEQKVNKIFSEMEDVILNQDLRELMNSNFPFNNLFSSNFFKNIFYTYYFLENENILDHKEEAAFYKKYINPFLDKCIINFYQKILDKKDQNIIHWLTSHNNHKRGLGVDYRTMDKNGIESAELQAEFRVKYSSDRTAIKDLDKNIAIFENFSQNLKSDNLKFFFHLMFFQELNGFLYYDIQENGANKLVPKAIAFLDDSEKKNPNIISNFLKDYCFEKEALINEKIIYYYRKTVFINKKIFYSLEDFTEMMNSIIKTKREFNDMAVSFEEKNVIDTFFKKKTLSLSLKKNLPIMSHLLSNMYISVDEIKKIKGKLSSDYEPLMNEVLLLNKNKFAEGIEKKIVETKWIEFEEPKKDNEVTFSMVAHINENSVLEIFTDFNSQTIYEDPRDPFLIKSSDIEIHFNYTSSPINSGSKRILTFKLLLNDEQKKEFDEFNKERFIENISNLLITNFEDSNRKIVTDYYNDRNLFVRAIVDAINSSFKHETLFNKMEDKTSETKTKLSKAKI